MNDGFGLSQVGTFINVQGVGVADIGDECHEAGQEEEK
jgi:hypothetical protein